jgi:hypothetical protein
MLKLANKTQNFIRLAMTLDAQGPLARRGEHSWRSEFFDDVIGEVKSLETRDGQDNCIELAVAKLPKAGVDIPANSLDFQIIA